MGRRALTKEQRQIRKKQQNQKFVSNFEKLTKKRETDRLQKREQRRETGVIFDQDGFDSDGFGLISGQKTDL
jgi:hypothetical protein